MARWCRIWMASAVIAFAFAALVSPAPAAPGPSLGVDANADRRTISPDIYGLNFADAALARAIDLPVDRWGGNRTDSYNWQLGSSNTGEDYFYENIADCWDTAHNYCTGGPVLGYREFVDKDRAVGAKTLLTLPMMGHVAKDAKLGHPFTCGFPRTLFPTQDAFDPFDTNCGNGRSGGAPLPSNPTRDGTPIGPAFNAAWIADLRARYGSAAAGGVSLYELGNEPALWNDTHRNMHPAATTYDELWGKSRALAEAVRAADPGAKVLGFAEWGWPNYFCSAADTVAGNCLPTSPDRAAHGGTPIVEWLLQRMRAYEQANGIRLIDYLDLHYYRQGGTTADVTRSLWDATYTDPSYIADQIRLIPRMKEWVAANYPGTKLALSEYNLSVPGDPLLNALIQADTLGIFAREGVDLATRFEVDDDGNLIADAFRMFRSYDGAGSKFGDTWVRSASADQGTLAVYGAQRASDGAYTVLVINKTAAELTSPLVLSGVTPAGPAQLWRWTGGGIGRGADVSVLAGGFEATYPARSMTLFVVPTQGGGPGQAGAGLPVPAPAATFGPDTLVTLSLAKSSIPAKGPLGLVAGNANDFAVSGPLTVQSPAPSRARAAKKKKKKAKPKPIAVASGTLQVAAKTKQTINLALSSKARSLLKKQRKLKLTATATVRDPAGATRTVTQALTVRLAKPKPKRKRKG